VPARIAFGRLGSLYLARDCAVVRRWVALRAATVRKLFRGRAVAGGKIDRGVMKAELKTIRALLVDDHALFRESVARVLAGEPHLEVQHCASIRDALPMLAQQPFDVVLLDHDLGSERASQFLPAAR